MSVSGRSALFSALPGVAWRVYALRSAAPKEIYDCIYSHKTRSENAVHIFSLWGVAPDWGARNCPPMVGSLGLGRFASAYFGVAEYA